MLQSTAGWFEQCNSADIAKHTGLYMWGQTCVKHTFTYNMQGRCWESRLNSCLRLTVHWWSHYWQGELTHQHVIICALVQLLLCYKCTCRVKYGLSSLDVVIFCDESVLFLIALCTGRHNFGSPAPLQVCCWDISARRFCVQVCTAMSAWPDVAPEKPA